MIKKIIHFLIYSSADPQKISLTLKGLGILLGLLGLESLEQDLGGFILSASQIIALMVTLWGFARKIGNTLKSSR